MRFLIALAVSHLLVSCQIPHPRPPSRAAVAAVAAWPMPRQNGRLSGHSERPGLIWQPRVAGYVDLGNRRCPGAQLVDLDGDGVDEILAEDARGLLAVRADGTVLWRADTYRTPVVTVTDLDGDGTVELVLRGPEVRSAEDGELLWKGDGAARHAWRILTGSFLPEYPGQQIVTVTMHGYDLAAHVYVFEQGIRGRVLWERTFQTSDFGDYGSAMVSDLDGDGRLELCVAVQGGFAVLDLRTGLEKLRGTWDVGDGDRVRNYGQLEARDVDGDGRAEVVLLNTLVSLQLAVARVDGDGVSLMWNRYWGEWYPKNPHLLHTVPSSLSDVNGDGRLEIAVSIYEDGHGWRLHVVDAATGQVLSEEPGLYLEAVVPRPGRPALLLASEQTGPVPAHFAPLRGLTLVDGTMRTEWEHPAGHLEGGWANRRGVGLAPTGSAAMNLREPILGDWSGDGGADFVIAEDRDGDGRTDRLAAIDPGHHPWQEAWACVVDPAEDLRVLQPMPDGPGAPPRLLVASGQGDVWTLDGSGRQTGRFAAGGAFVPGAAAGDIDGDGRNEILTVTSDGRVQALRFTGQGTGLDLLWERSGWGTSGQLPSVESPLLADVDGDGRYEILVGIYEDGHAGLACLDGSGARRWSWFAPGKVPSPRERGVKSWTVGHLRGGGSPDVFVTTRRGDQTGGDLAQECWALDGRTGEVVWHTVAEDIEDFYWYRTLGPSDLASLLDVDGDGAEDVLMMSHPLLVVLSGRDGRPLQRPIYPTTQLGEGTPWTAEGSAVVSDLDGDGPLELLLSGTFGAWGAMTVTGERIWAVDPGTEQSCRSHGGLGDVDGDGRLELAMPHGTGLRCYDVARGTLEWTLPDVVGTTDVIVADIDGDGVDDLVLGAGQRLVAVNGRDGGSKLWEIDLGAESGPPIAADVDGDGFVEVVVGAADGRLRVVAPGP